MLQVTGTFTAMATKPLPQSPKWWFLGILVLLGVFIAVQAPVQNERAQLDNLLPGVSPLEDYNMPGPLSNFTDPLAKMNQLFSSADKSFAQQRQQMTNQMQTQMQAMDAFQKQLQGSKPYKVDNQGQFVTITISLKDKNDALNYQVDVQQDGFTVQHRQAIGASDQDAKQGKTYSQTQSQTYMESVSEPLDAEKSTQMVKNNQLIVTIPKKALEPGNETITPPAEDIYDGSEGSLRSTI